MFSNKMARACGAVLMAALLAGVVGGVVWWRHEGLHLYVVKTGSMVPTYRPGDAVVDRPAAGGYRVGQPVTVQITAAGDVVTHRLRAVDARGLLHTQGDANRTADAWALPADRVRGVVSRDLPRLGYALVFLQQRNGVLGVMTSALAVILLWGICFPAVTTAPAEERSAERRPSRLRIPVQRRPGHAGQVSVVALRVPPSSPPGIRMPPTAPPSTWRGEPVPAVRVLPSQREG